MEMPFLRLEWMMILALVVGLEGSAEAATLAVISGGIIDRERSAAVIVE